jgi:hypothetical protein
LEIFVSHVRPKMTGKPYQGCFISFFHLWIQLVSERGGGGGGGLYLGTTKSKVACCRCCTSRLRSLCISPTPTFLQDNSHLIEIDDYVHLDVNIEKQFVTFTIYGCKKLLLISCHVLICKQKINYSLKIW